MFSRIVRRAISTVMSFFVILSLLLPAGGWIGGNGSPFIRDVYAGAGEAPLALLTAGGPLTPKNLSGAILYINLIDDAAFIESELDVSSFTFYSGPQGLSVSEVVYNHSQEVMLTIDFSGPQNGGNDNLGIQIDGKVLEGGKALSTNLLPIYSSSYTYFNVDTYADTVDIKPGDGLCADENGLCSLRAAVMEVNANEIWDSIDIFLEEGTYELSLEGTDENGAATGDLDILKPVTIMGAGMDKTSIDAKGNDRVFDVHDAFNLYDLTITGGYTEDVDGGAAILIRDNFEVYLYDVTIQGNHSAAPDGATAATIGGAIVNYGQLHLHYVTIDSNWTEGSGGGLLNYNDANLYQTTLSNNSAELTGGGLASFGELNVTESMINLNTAGETGSAIYSSDGIIDVSESKIIDNSVSGSGATIAILYPDSYRSSSVFYSEITGNDADQDIYLVGDFDTVLYASYNYWGEDGPGEVYAMIGEEEVPGMIQLYPYFMTEEMEEQNMSGYTNDLKDLIFSTGTLTPSFHHQVVQYTLYVDADTDKVSITPLLFAPQYATVIIQGVELQHEKTFVMDVDEDIVELPIYVQSVIDDTKMLYVIIERIMPSREFVVNTTLDLPQGCYVEEDDCSLRAAIFRANETNSHDTIHLEPGTYELSLGEMEIRHPLTIIGAGPDETMIDASLMEDMMFKVTSRELHLSGVTLTGVNSMTGVIRYEDMDGTHSMVDVIVENNSTGTSGNGNIVELYGGELSLTNTIIRGNVSGDSMFFVHEYGRLVAEDSLFENNTSTYSNSSGAIENRGEMELTRVIFRGNEAEHGAIMNGGSMVLDTVTFEQNRAITFDDYGYAAGGAIYNSGDALITDSIFDGNEATLHPEDTGKSEWYELVGGAIYNIGSMVISSSGIRNNRAGDDSLDSSKAHMNGGAIFNFGNLEITNSEVNANHSLKGGGIYTAGSLTIEDSNIYGNSAEIGGGLYIEECGFVCDDYGMIFTSVSNSTINSNDAQSYGGGIYNEGSLEITDGKILNNDALQGGGIYSSGQMVIEHSEISGNTADAGGGLYSMCDWNCEERNIETVILYSAIHGNQARLYGGGAAMLSPVYTMNSVFSSNQAGAVGGGLMSTVGLISYSTFAGNTLTGEGLDELEEIINSSNYDLEEPSGSGFFNYTDNPETRLTMIANSIIDGDTEWSVCAGPALFIGANIVNNGCDGATIQGTFIDEDPRLAELTWEHDGLPVHALLPGSPALDAGVPITENDITWNGFGSSMVDVLMDLLNPVDDIRTYSRMQGKGNDLGAYEVIWAAYPILPYYDIEKKQIVIWFDREYGLVTDPITATPDIGKFQVFHGGLGDWTPVEIEDIEYGSDGRSVVLKLSEQSQLWAELSVTMETNAVQFENDSLYAHWMEHVPVLTPWLLYNHLYEIASSIGEGEHARIDTGVVMKVFNDEMIGYMLPEYQQTFLQDELLLKILMSFIEPAFIYNHSDPVVDD